MKIKSKYGFIIFLCCVCFAVANLILLMGMLVYGKLSLNLKGEW